MLTVHHNHNVSFFIFQNFYFRFEIDFEYHIFLGICVPLYMLGFISLSSSLGFPYVLNVF